MEARGGLEWRPPRLGWRPKTLEWRPGVWGVRRRTLGWRPAAIGKNTSVKANVAQQRPTKREKQWQALCQLSSFVAVVCRR
eukprot:11884671-Alexandrium_andersonii.AAC.1